MLVPSVSAGFAVIAFTCLAVSSLRGIEVVAVWTGEGLVPDVGWLEGDISLSNWIFGKG